MAQQQGDRPGGEAGFVSPPSAQGPGAHIDYEGATLSANSSHTHDEATLSATSSNTQDEKHLVTSSVLPSRLSHLNPKNWSRKMKIIGLAAVISTFVVLVPAIAIPLTLNHDRQTPSAGAVPSSPLVVDPPSTVILANNTPLHIMALGASITYGFLSSNGNGYREDLRVLIERGGNTNITYVGSRNNGTMTNNAVEGWPGYRIDQVFAKAESAVPASLPNVILLNVGTNDCVQDYNMENTTKISALAPSLTANSSYTVGDRMRLLVEDLLKWSPNATVVMSTLILNKVEVTNRRVNEANAKFAAVAASLQAQGRRVVLANMSAAAGGPNATTMADVTHPNDLGYSMMANRWYLALREASDRMMIVAPH